MRLIKKLHWLFIRSFIGPFVGTFFIALFLLLMQTIWKYLEDLVGKGLELHVILEFIFYFAIHLIPLALPLAILLSSIMVFGNMAERYELVAIKSSGVSLLRAMRPMFVMSVILAIAAFYTANNFIPKANLSWGALLYDVTQKKPAMNITNNVFFKDIEGYAIRVGKKHDDNQTIEDILIYVDDRRHAGNNNILIAKRGKMTITEDQRYMHLYLEDGKRYQELVNDPNYKVTMPHNTMEFQTYEMTIDLSELQFNRTDKNRFSEDHRMLNVKQLKQRIDSLNTYIANKKTGLYRYLEPYFYTVTDSLEIEEDNLEERLAYLNTLAIETKRKKDSLAKLDTLALSDTINRVALAKGLPSLLSPRVGERKTQRIEHEKVIDRAILNANNIERIVSGSIDNTKPQKDLRSKYLVERHRKYTLAVSCILLFFIGAPLGAILRKGGFGYSLTFSILLFILYYVLNILGEKLAVQGQLPSVLGMWMSTIILFPLAIFLTYKASRESRLFDVDTYNRIARMLGRIFKFQSK